MFITLAANAVAEKSTAGADRVAAAAFILIVADGE